MVDGFAECFRKPGVSEKEEVVVEVLHQLCGLNG